MATAVSYNGVTYNVPAIGEGNWGGTNGVDGLLISLAQNSLQKSGGLFSLSGDVDFGPSAGVVSTYLKSRSANIAGSGTLRLANGDSIAFRNHANNGDLVLTPNSSDQLTWAGSVLLTTTGTIANNMALVSNGSGSIISHASTTATEIGYLSTAGSNIHGDSDVATLTNKTMAAGSNTFSGFRHGTEVDQPSSGVHGVTGSIVGTTDSQTLTNKTLTSPTINTPSISGGTLSSSSLTSPSITGGTLTTVTVDGLSTALVSKTAAYTLTTSDDTAEVSASGGAVTITLPTAVGATGKIYRVKKTDSTGNAVTAATTSAQTIDGATTLVMGTQNDCVAVQSDGSNWIVIERNVTVAASYVCNGSQSISNNSVTALTCYGAKNYDSHGAFNTSTGVFTAPVAGKYRCSLQLLTNAAVTASAGVGSQFQAIFEHNGTSCAQGFMFAPTASSATTYFAQITETISCAAGDTITIAAYSNLTGGSVTVGNGVSNNAQFCIERIGN